MMPSTARWVSLICQDLTNCTRYIFPHFLILWHAVLMFPNPCWVKAKVIHELGEQHCMTQE